MYLYEQKQAGTTYKNEDIFNLRKEKIVKILKNIDPDTPVAYLSSVGSAEMNYVRPAFSSAYSIVNKMQNVLQSSEGQNW